MRCVTVFYRLQNRYWGAECPQVPQLVEGDASLTGLVDLVHTAFRDFTVMADLETTDVIEESAGIG